MNLPDIDPPFAGGGSRGGGRGGGDTAKCFLLPHTSVSRKKPNERERRSQVTGRFLKAAAKERDEEKRGEGRFRGVPRAHSFRAFFSYLRYLFCGTAGEKKPFSSPSLVRIPRAPTSKKKKNTCNYVTPSSTHHYSEGPANYFDLFFGESTTAPFALLRPQVQASSSNPFSLYFFSFSAIAKVAGGDHRGIKK